MIPKISQRLLTGSLNFTSHQFQVRLRGQCCVLMTWGLLFSLCFSRWCVLTGNSLDYYKSYVKNSPKFGSIVLTSLCSVVSPEEREPGTILTANILLLYLKERRRTDQESKQSAKFLFPYFANLGALPSLLIFVFDFRTAGTLSSLFHSLEKIVDIEYFFLP